MILSRLVTAAAGGSGIVVTRRMTPSIRARTSLVRLRLDVQVGGAVVYRSGDEPVDELDRRRARSRVGDVLASSGRVGGLLRRTTRCRSRCGSSFRSRFRWRVAEATARRTFSPSASRRSSEARTFVGSATATSTSPSERSARATPGSAARTARAEGRRHSVDFRLVQVDELEAVLLGEHACEGRRVNPAVATRISPSRKPVRPSRRAPLELLGADQPVAEQERTERAARGCPASPSASRSGGGGRRCPPPVYRTMVAEA